MPAPNGLRDLVWDSASCASIVFGIHRVPLLKFSPSKVETKIEKIKAVGSARATRRTPGVTEIADASGEITATDFEANLLPVFGRHGSNLIQFVITAHLQHPSIAGSFTTLLDGVRIVSEEGPELTGDEKAVVTKLGFSVMQVWRKGRDGLWKCQSYETTLPSAQARALIRI